MTDKVEKLSIKFEKVNLKQVLEKGIFELLSGQREYIWERQQWEELWDDILDTLKEMDRNENSLYTFHFFGPMFFIPSNESKMFFILDGQQRLATVSIILALLRDLLDVRRTLGVITQEDIDIYGKIDDILFIGQKSKYARLTLGEKTRDFYEKLIKLKEVGSIDVKLSFLEKESKTNKSTELLFRCYKFFLTQFYSNFSQRKKYSYLSKNLSYEGVKTLLREEEVVSFIHKIYEALMEYFYVLKVEVPVYDLGFEIFETLNQRGTKLEPAELFKNLVFSKLEKNLGKEKVNEIWNSIINPLDKNKFGTFLRHYWISKFEHISNKKLFRSIRRITNNMTSEEFVSLLNEMANEAFIYSALLDHSHTLWENEDEISSLIDEINFLRFRQVFPLLVVLYRKFRNKERNEFKKLLKLFLNFSVRSYTILDRNPNEFERKYSEWARLLREDKIEIKEIIEFLKENWPSDDEIKNKIIGMQVKNEKKAKYILVKVNDALEKTLLHTTWSNQPTLEHVIPRNPNEEWKRYLKSKNMKHEKFVNRLGNLTILSQKENRELGNIPYSEKRKKYLEMDVPLNKVTFEKLEEFDEEAIRKREEIIANLIVEKKLWEFEN